MNENNYATIYKYDSQGALVGTDLETDKGMEAVGELRRSEPKVR